MIEYTLKNIMSKTTGLKRNTIDKYYTSDKAVQTCMGFIQEHINITNSDICIEPSAGNGAFIPAIQSVFSNHRFYDLEPENDLITQQDYLTFDYTEDAGKVHVIGNPPFGRQSSLAIKFIKKSAKFCDSISFILPKSFKKDSLKKHFPLKFHLLFEFDLPIDSFLVDGKTYDVPCVFQIWEKKVVNREVPKKLVPSKFKFVKKEDNPDISFRRIGVNAGLIETNCDKSVQSHYFISFDNPVTAELLLLLHSIDYECKNYTVGPKSISKEELIKEFNQIL